MESKAQHTEQVDSDEERNRNRELFDAICKGNLDKIKLHLESGVRTNIIDRNNKDNSPLHYAVEKGKKEVVKELLLPKWKTNINAQNNKGDTPLHIAASSGNKELVQLLLNNQAEVGVKNNNNESLLDIAKRCDVQDIVQILCTELNQRSSVEQQLAVHQYLQQSDKEIYNIFLKENKEKLQSQKDTEARTTKIDELLNAITQELHMLKTGKINSAEIGKRYVDMLTNLIDSQLLLKEHLSDKYKISLHQLSELQDTNGNTPLLLAALKGSLNSLSFLIRLTQEENIYHANKNNKRAIDIAWEKLLENLDKERKKYFECVFVLLENDSPFPDSFNLNAIKDVDSSKIQSLIQNRETLHSLIHEKRLEEVKDFVSKNEITKFYFNLDNQSILFTALRLKKYNIYAFLKFRGCILFEKEEENFLVALSPDIKEQIKIEQEKYYNRPDLIFYLLSKSGGFLNKRECHEKVKSCYEFLDSLAEVSILLKIIEYADSLKSITFDFNKDTIVEIEHGGLYDAGIVHHRKGRIYVAGNVEGPELRGTLAHELTHFAMQIIYDNDCKPYYQGDRSSELKFNELAQNIKMKKEIDDIMSRVFTVYRDEAQWNAELIARVPHILAKYGTSEGRKQLKNQVPELLEFYNKNITQYLKDNLPLIERSVRVNQLNKKFKVKCEIKESGIQFRNHFKLNSFLDSENKNIFLLANASSWLSSINVYQALKNLPSHSPYFMSYIFCNESHLTDPEYGIVDNFELYQACNLFVVQFRSDFNQEKLDGVLRKLVRSEKKVILISQGQHSALVKLLKSKYKDEVQECGEEENRNIEFSNLLDDSQTYVLKKEVVFQGKERVTLNKLIRIEDAKHAIDTDFLDKLAKGDGKIASKLLGISDLDNVVYHNVFMEIELKRLRDNYSDDDIDIGGGLFDSEEVDKQKEDYDLFIVAGIEKEVLANELEISEEKIRAFSEHDPDRNNPIQFVLLAHGNDDDNLKNFKEICHNYPTRTIHFIEFKNNKIAWNHYYDPYYIPRKFHQLEIDVKKIKEYTENKNNEINKDIFVVSGINNAHELSDIILKDAVGASTDINLDKKCVIILRGQNWEQSFSDLCERLKDINIHWLEKKVDTMARRTEETIFVWKRSLGKVEKLREGFIKKITKLTNSESELIEIIKDERCVIIADSPGMGKSTTLAVLSEKYHKKRKYEWIIRIDLQDCRAEINKLPSNIESEVDEVTNFLSSLSKNSISTEEGLLKHRLIEQGQLLLLFDGFDEIDSSRQKKIVSLVKFMKEKTKAKLVITTRPYEKLQKNLEGTLSVLAFDFQPISLSDSQGFLEHFWKSRLKLKYSQKDLESFQYSPFAEVLLNKFNKIIGEKMSKFMGIPLHTRMLAEAFLTGEKGFEENRYELDKNKLEKLFGYLNIVHLYQYFIKNKYEIYFSEKAKLGSCIIDDDRKRLENSYTEDHQRLAFKYLFEECSQAFGIFFPGNLSFESNLSDNDAKKDINRIGIAESKTDGINFTHRTFAEYFVSELILDRLGKNANDSIGLQEKMWTFLLVDIFIEPNNFVIRNFINCKLDDKSLEPINANLVNELLLKQRVVDRNSLYVAVQEGLEKIASFLLKSIGSCLNDDNLNDFIELINEGLLLSSMIGGRCKQLLENLLKYVADKDPDRLIDIINVGDSKFTIPLHLALVDEEMVDILLKYVNNNDQMVEIFNYGVDDECGPVLFRAVEDYSLCDDNHILLQYLEKLDDEQRKEVLYASIEYINDDDPRMHILCSTTVMSKAVQVAGSENYFIDPQYVNLKNLDPSRSYGDQDSDFTDEQDSDITVEQDSD